MNTTHTKNSIPAFDSHAHLDMTKGGIEKTRALINDAFDDGLAGIVSIAGATKVGEFDTALQLSTEYPSIWVAAGVHPHASEHLTLKIIDDLKYALDKPKMVAMGEMGLDYHYNFSEPKVQRQGFIKQLRLAHEKQLPVVIHTRNADDDTLAILKDEGADQLGGVIHCFSSTDRLATEALGLGFYLSFSGIVTFPKSTEIQQVGTTAPENRILTETDSPFLSPVPHRGKVNEPKRVVHIVEKLAELRQVEPEHMGRITVENTVACFNLTEHGFDLEQWREGITNSRLNV